MNREIKCEGACDKHRGDVAEVRVFGNGWQPMRFNYCQEAIEEDERRGFVVQKENEVMNTKDLKSS